MLTTPNDALWFMNNLVSVRVAQADNADGMSVLEMRKPFGEGPPVHIHHAEDEIFVILEGTVKFEVDGAVRLASAGEVVLAGRGTRHGFRVVSPEGARVLTITRGGFEGMVRSVSRPAVTSGLPEPAEPTEAFLARLTAECAARGIEIVGPPIA